MILEVCWGGLWTLSFGHSQCHGHGSWLVCEVALSMRYINRPTPFGEHVQMRTLGILSRFGCIVYGTSTLMD